MWWHTVTHGWGSEEKTGEWSGQPVPFSLPRNIVYPSLLPTIGADAHTSPASSRLNWRPCPWPLLLVVVGLVDNRPDHDQQQCYHHAPTVKPVAATVIVELLMMGVRTPETCWAVHKRQVIKLEKLLHLDGWFIWIADNSRGLQIFTIIS
jgi:hypothetical protein